MGDLNIHEQTQSDEVFLFIEPDYDAQYPAWN